MDLSGRKQASRMHTSYIWHEQGIQSPNLHNLKPTQGLTVHTPSGPCDLLFKAHQKIAISGRIVDGLPLCGVRVKLVSAPDTCGLFMPYVAHMHARARIGTRIKLVWVHV